MCIRDRVTRADFGEFDYVLGMDMKNMQALSDICPDKYSSKLTLFHDYAQSLSTREVPDPYYGGADGFDLVLNLTEAASDGLIAAIRDPKT